MTHRLPVSICIHCNAAVVLVIIMQCRITICSPPHVIREQCGDVDPAAKKSQIDGITTTHIRHKDPCVRIVQQHTVVSIRCDHTYVPSIQNASSSTESLIFLVIDSVKSINISRLATYVLITKSMKLDYDLN